jgi:Mn-dependent DtxR family transcriptional regulator
MDMPRGGEKPSSQDTPRSEDYLEAVYHLISDKGYATTSDISEALGVRPPTVSYMIGKLALKGYLEHEPYRGMKLTPSGEKLARSVIKRHQVISELISMIGVDDQTAFIDTEGIEHHVHPTTLHKLERLAEYLRTNPQTLKAIQKFVNNQ